jgi:hypothetical protein
VSVRRRVWIGVTTWVVTLAVVRVGIALPEACPPVSVADVRSAVAEAVAWFERNQHPAGDYLYVYDADAGATGGTAFPDDYNQVRHAGVTMSLYQAAASGHDGALEVADRGTAWALQRTWEDGDRLVYGPTSGRVSVGSAALVVAGLVERREHTGETHHDDVLLGMGRFLADQVEDRGSVLAYYDADARQPVPDRYSIFFTGEVMWALARLHTTFPDAGFDAPTERIGRYIATERDEAEPAFPPLPDHWGSYAYAEVAAWPGHRLAEVEIAYARRLAALFGTAIRSELPLQEGGWQSWTRPGPSRAAGVGTTGEGLTALWRAVQGDERLADLDEDVAERLRCLAGLMVERQVDADEADAFSHPDAARGAWFASGEVRMDDIQHALSFLVAVEEVVTSADATLDTGGEP